MSGNYSGYIPRGKGIQNRKPLIIVNIGICHIVSPWISINTKVTGDQDFFFRKVSDSVAKGVCLSNLNELHPVSVKLDFRSWNLVRAQDLRFHH